MTIKTTLDKFLSGKLDVDLDTQIEEAGIDGYLDGSLNQTQDDCWDDILDNAVVKNNTIYTKKSELDQFYTNSEVAKTCYTKVIDLYAIDSFDMVLEPSAGNGSFYNLLPQDKRVGLDLDPRCKGVSEQDFFEYVPRTNDKIITIGNPPFGKNASLAVKFFNHAAGFSDVIAFIIPKTFRKKSLQNRLNLSFHLKLDTDLEKDAFLLNGGPYNVPCCFQIWEKTANKRRITKPNLENDFFDFVKKDKADIAVRRVGGRAGKANKDVVGSSEVSHYFLKLKKGTSKAWMIETINGIDFVDIINSTAGVKSLSKPEFVDGVKKTTR
jgi:hypothetical protein